MMKKKSNAEKWFKEVYINLTTI